MAGPDRPENSSKQPESSNKELEILISEHAPTQNGAGNSVSQRDSPSNAGFQWPKSDEDAMVAAIQQDTPTPPEQHQHDEDLPDSIHDETAPPTNIGNPEPSLENSADLSAVLPDNDEHTGTNDNRHGVQSGAQIITTSNEGNGVADLEEGGGVGDHDTPASSQPPDSADAHPSIGGKKQRVSGSSTPQQGPQSRRRKKKNKRGKKNKPRRQQPQSGTGGGPSNRREADIPSTSRSLPEVAVIPQQDTGMVHQPSDAETGIRPETISFGYAGNPSSLSTSLDISRILADSVSIHPNLDYDYPLQATDGSHERRETPNLDVRAPVGVAVGPMLYITSAFVADQHQDIRLFMICNHILPIPIFEQAVGVFNEPPEEVDLRPGDELEVEEYREIAIRDTSMFDKVFSCPS